MDKGGQFTFKLTHNANYWMFLSIKIDKDKYPSSLLQALLLGLFFCIVPTLFCPEGWNGEGNNNYNDNNQNS